MLRTPVVIAVLALAAIGCKKDKDKDAPAAKTADAAVAKSIDAAPAAPKAPDAAPVAAAAPDAAPAAKTEVVKIEGIGAGRTYEVDAPAGTTVSVDEGNDEQFPRGELQVGELRIQLDDPEAGHSSLEDTKAMMIRSYPAGGVERADPDPDGYTLIYADDSKRYNVEVDRVEMDVRCGAWELKSRADADAVATICRTIREVK